MQSLDLMPPWQDDKFGSLTSLVLSYWSPKRKRKSISTKPLAKFQRKSGHMKASKHCTSGHNLGMHNCFTPSSWRSKGTVSVSLLAKSCTIELVFPFQHLVVNHKCGTANSFVNKADFNDCFIVRQFSWVNTINDVFFFEGPSDQKLSTKCHRNLSKLDCKLSSEAAPLTSKTAQLSNSILPQTVQLRLSSKTVQLTA